MMEGLPLYVLVRNRIKEGIASGIIQTGPDGSLPGQQEFAEKYNVSLITVKRAIKDLQEMGLVESGRGKGLRLKSSVVAASGEQIASERVLHIGVTFFDLLGSINNPIVRRLISGIDDCSREYMMALHMVSFPGLEVSIQEDTLFSNFPFMSLDGMLLLSPVSSASIANIIKNGMPCVSFNLLSDRNIACHVVDTISAYNKLTNALLKRGRRNIIVCVGDEAKISSYLSLSGYKNALSAHGMEFDESNVCPEDYSVEKTLGFVESCIRSGKPVDGIIAFDDLMACHVHDFLTSIGRNDILIAAPGNLEESIGKVAISVDQRLQEIGYGAAKCLYGMMNGMNPRKSKLYYEPILVERDAVHSPAVEPLANYGNA